jgi:thiol-disulfide isomerase/thioredoxin
MESVSGALYARAKSQPGSRDERIRLNSEILAEGRKCLADHPEVPRTSNQSEILVRRVLLPAAERLYENAPSPENRDTLRQLAEDVVSLPVYEGHLLVPEKTRAGYLRAKLAIYPKQGGPPQDAAKHIRALIEAFPVRPELKEPEALHGQALVYAAQLACEAGEKALAGELCKTIAERYLSASQALDVLAQAGHPALFEGELTTLDGKKLTFPGDGKGKIVLVDFWATWCAPCRASLPHVKALHEAYKDRGVLVVGVSCDMPRAPETVGENRQKVADFVTTNGYSWTQTYSGEWPKAAEKYGVSSIPRVFLLDREGRVLTTSARGREEELIRQALGSSDQERGGQLSGKPEAPQSTGRKR